jgi:quercetin dioxygenase-like cupin family protein
MNVVRFGRDRAMRLLYDRLMRKGLGNPWRREALFGGTGEVLVWDLMGGARFPPFTAVLACELAPGGRVGVHRQEQYPEIVVVTEGVGTAKVDGAPCPLEIGTVIALPLGSTLALANSSDTEPLRYLIIKAEPPGAKGD